MTIIEKIIAAHSKQSAVKPGDIVDVFIDARVARDFGGANVVENILNNGLSVNDPSRTFFTFDCNPGGSDQKYAANQHFCRLYARQNDIKVYDVDAGVGTHLAIDKGLRTREVLSFRPTPTQTLWAPSVLSGREWATRT